MVRFPRQFSIYWCNLEPAFGRQIKKTRPCVVVSPDEMNEPLGTVIVVPLTSTLRQLPFYVPVQYHRRHGALACDQLKTIDKRRVGRLFAPLNERDTRALSGVLVSLFQIEG
jgi:mRNA interferase MazF